MELKGIINKIKGVRYLALLKSAGMLFLLFAFGFLKVVFDLISTVFLKFIKSIKWYWSLPMKKKLKVGLYTCLGGFVSGLLGLVFFFYLVYYGFWGAIPSQLELKDINNYQASEVFTKDSVLIGRYFVENRSDCRYEEVNPKLLEALIATEDARFYEHTGVDHKSLMRVLFKSIILGQNAGGGSTLSQQLAKNLFGRESYGALTMPIVKIKEAVIANRMEEVYTKQEILMLYLNTVSFGEDTYGIKTACERFFSKSPQNIEVEELAVLVGMLKAPSTYNPRLHPEKSRERRNVVLSQMVKGNYITENKYKKLAEEAIELNYKRTRAEDVAPHLKAVLEAELLEWLKEYNKTQGTTYDLYKSGLKIYTTIDSRLQRIAVKAVDKHLNKLQRDLIKDVKKQKILSLRSEWFQAYLKSGSYYKALIKKGESEDAAWNSLSAKNSKRKLYVAGEWVDSTISYVDSVRSVLAELQSGFMVCEPHTGDVLAWVGGKDFGKNQYDHIRSKRQVGSIIKPIIYSKALIDGHEPCDYVSNQQVVYTEYDDWTPRNSGDNYKGKYTIKGALTNSVNTVSVKLCMESGIDQVVDYAYKLGIKDSISRLPSLCLGVDDFSLFNILEVYTVFANKGKKSKLNHVVSIYDNERKVLYKSEVYHEEAIPEDIALKMTMMLQNVAQHGTAQRLASVYGIDTLVAGKTGTSQNHKDGWFVGYTPRWLGGVWVGADNPAIRFSSIRDGQGANMALPIWAEFYKMMKKDPALRHWLEGDFDSELEFDCEDYRDNTRIERFFKRKGVRESDATGFEKNKASRKGKGFKLFRKK